jgi:hypothetical protein
MLVRSFSDFVLRDSRTKLHEDMRRTRSIPTLATQDYNRLSNSAHLAA